MTTTTATPIPTEAEALRLARHPSREVRRRLASSPELWRWAGAAWVLAHDDDASVRRALAGNPHAVLDALEELAADKAFGVRRALASNPRARAAGIEVRVGAGGR